MYHLQKERMKHCVLLQLKCRSKCLSALSDKISFFLADAIHKPHTLPGMNGNKGLGKLGYNDEHGRTGINLLSLQDVTYVYTFNLFPMHFIILNKMEPTVFLRITLARRFWIRHLD